MSSSGKPTVTPTQRLKSGLTQTDLEHHKQELGLLGGIFGSRENAPYYIAAIVIVAMLILIFVVMLSKPSTDMPRLQTITLLITVISGVVGYIFGKSKGL